MKALTEASIKKRGEGRAEPYGESSGQSSKKPLKVDGMTGESSDLQPKDIPS